MDLLQTWSQELLKINESALCEPKFYKLRSDLFEVVSKCFLEDSFDEYIENSHKIFKMIIETNIEKGGSNMYVN